MTVRALATLSLLALVSSCAVASRRGPAVADQTPRVSPETPPVRAEEPAPVIPVTLAGLSPLDRFAFFDDPNGTTVLVVAEARSFRLPGHVLTDEVSYASPETEAGLRGNDAGQRPRMLSDTLALVRDASALAVVDLEKDGVTVARFPKDAVGVARSPEGDYAAWTADHITFAFAGRARVEVPSKITWTATSFTWGKRFVRWTADDGDHLFDRGREAERPVPSGARIELDADGLFYFASTPTFIELWQGEEAKPRLHVDVANGWGAYLDQAKRFVGFTDTGDQGLFLNVIDLATKRRTRFAARGAACEGEIIKSIERGQVTSDATCDPGCGSLGPILTPHLVVYEAKTGKVLSEQPQTRGPDQANPYYVAMAEAQRELEQLHVAPSEIAALVRHPRGGRFLRSRQGALVELDATGAEATRFFGVTAPVLHYLYVGEDRVLATADGRAFLFHEKGDRLWSSASPAAPAAPAAAIAAIAN